MSTGSPNKPREWAPRFWEGADFFAWLRLLAQHRFAVEPPYLYIAAIVSLVSFNNTILRWIQSAFHRDQTPSQPPIFVLGHWRTGTTLLHELLVLDPRFISPTTHQCFNPCHYLLSEELFLKYLNFLLPSNRPMDRMAAGWARPQEDEFALCLLGEPSTYADIAFPNQPTVNTGALDLSGLTPSQVRHWKRTLKQFISGVSQASQGKTVVLKSPPHTARVRHLIELFPSAKFIHIRRDPYTLYASTMNLWKSLASKHGLQTPRGGAVLEEKVLREFRIIYERLFQDRCLVPSSQWYDVQYEEFVQDQLGSMQKIYDHLELGDFHFARPQIEQYISDNKNYETNKYQLTSEQKMQITARWRDLIQTLGYPVWEKDSDGG